MVLTFNFNYQTRLQFISITIKMIKLLYVLIIIKILIKSTLKLNMLNIL